MNHGKIGEVYNFGGESELTNIECLKRIINNIDSNIDHNELINYVDDRLGHDTRYAINPKKTMCELGWKPNETFDSGILKTISWYSKNVKWLKIKLIRKNTNHGWQPTTKNSSTWCKWPIR